MSKKQSFNNFMAELQKIQAAAETGMEKAVTKLETDTKAITHVDTGALRRSWTHKVQSSKGSVEGAVGSNLEYAPYEDDYHGNLSTALNTNCQAYFQTVADEVKKAVGA